jgi:hypothetical protein
MESRKSTSRGSTSRPRGIGAPGGNEPAAAALDSTTASTPDSGRSTGIVGKAKERATAQLSTQKDRATDGLGSIARAVRQSTSSLRENQQETVAQYVEKAADHIERFSNTLREKDVDELLREAQQFARRRPALFIGGSFAVGLLAARFLKSSSDAPISREYSTAMSDEGRRSAGIDAAIRGAY